jgi:hypothetical protein
MRLRVLLKEYFSFLFFFSFFSLDFYLAVQGQFTNQGQSLTITDRATMVADYIILGGVNTTNGTSVSCRQMVFDSYDDRNFEGYVNILLIYIYIL